MTQIPLKTRSQVLPGGKGVLIPLRELLCDLWGVFKVRQVAEVANKEQKLESEEYIQKFHIINNVL